MSKGRPVQPPTTTITPPLIDQRRVTWTFSEPWRPFFASRTARSRSPASGWSHACRFCRSSACQSFDGASPTSRPSRPPCCISPRHTLLPPAYEAAWIHGFVHAKTSVWIGQCRCHSVGRVACVPPIRIGDPVTQWSIYPSLCCAPRLAYPHCGEIMKMWTRRCGPRAATSER
jgi:hypothetical protein